MNFVEPLASHHQRASFDCGKEPLNRFFREQARQNADRHLGVTRVVLSEPGDSQVQAYYTLVTRTVESQLPHLLRAMAEVEQASHLVGIYALVLDTIDEPARDWYLRLNFGFEPLPEESQRLFVPLSFIQQLGLEAPGPEL